MNLFPEEERKTKEDLYYKDIEEEEADFWSEYVSIRQDVRTWIKNKDLTPILKQLAEEILIKGKPNYKKTKDLFRRFTAAINPCPGPKE